jgi:hypothetical protein
LSDAWLHVLLPRNSAALVPYVERRAVAYAETPLGLRVALPDVAPGEQVVVTLVERPGTTATGN